MSHVAWHILTGLSDWKVDTQKRKSGCSEMRLVCCSLPYKWEDVNFRKVNALLEFNSVNKLLNWLNKKIEKQIGSTKLLATNCATFSLMRLAHYRWNQWNFLLPWNFAIQKTAQNQWKSKIQTELKHVSKRILWNLLHSIDLALDRM